MAAPYYPFLPHWPPHWQSSAVTTNNIGVGQKNSTLLGIGNNSNTNQWKMNGEGQWCSNPYWEKQETDTLAWNWSRKSGEWDRHSVLWYELQRSRRLWTWARMHVPLGGLKSVIHTSLAECKTMCKSREDTRELNSKIKLGSICVPLEHRMRSATLKQIHQQYSAL